MTIDQFQKTYGTTTGEIVARGFRLVAGEMNSAGTGYYPPAEWNGTRTGGYSRELVPCRCQQWSYGSPATHGRVAIYPQ